jgi:hypothetical protein
LCSVSESELRIIHRLCVQLAVATNTKDYEVSAEPGDGGLLPALASYADRPTVSGWRRVRNEATLFASTATDLLQVLGRPGGIIDALEADERARVLAQLRHGLSMGNLTLDQMRFGERPTTDDAAAATEALYLLGDMPKLTERAQRTSAELIEMRATARC